MIEVKNITKYYGTKLAVDNISFTVEKGEIVGFLGPNGAGKTTTMRMITGYLYPDKGSIKVAGADVIDDAVEAKKHIGYLPEIAPLYNEMPVKEYLGFVADIKGVDKDYKAEHINDIMKKTGLIEKQDSIISHLSKGYRQRVGIAEALVNNPDVLILDEPTIGLDPNQIIEIRNLIKTLGKEHTVILSSHILQEVSAICEKIIIINDGKLVAIDSQKSLLEKVESGMRVRIIAKGDKDALQSTLSSISGIKNVELVNADDSVNELILTLEKDKDMRNEIAKTVINSNFELLELSKVTMSLEEVFIKLTGEQSKE